MPDVANIDPQRPDDSQARLDHLAGIAEDLLRRCRTRGASQAEMIASMKRGLYCANFGGGQVDITNGKFVFQCTEAYLIEDGRITAPVRGATLIGDGATALTRIEMVGDDFAFDPGVGVCGKAGQGVPVGIGQPSLKITGLTVGGTAV